jgi:hypothetical protein
VQPQTIVRGLAAPEASDDRLHPARGDERECDGGNRERRVDSQQVPPATRAGEAPPSARTTGSRDRESGSPARSRARARSGAAQRARRRRPEGRRRAESAPGSAARWRLGSRGQVGREAGCERPGEPAHHADEDQERTDEPSRSAEHRQAMRQASPRVNASSVAMQRAAPPLPFAAVTSGSRRLNDGEGFRDGNCERYSSVQGEIRLEFRAGRDLPRHAPRVPAAGRPEHHPCIVRPPETLRTCPVTYAAPSESR